MTKVTALLFIMLLAAGSALAGCPDEQGIWSSNPELNPDYPLLNGRISEAWCPGDGNPDEPLQPGNTQVALSFDGSTLGGEWTLTGMQINEAGPVLLFDGVTGGNGVRIYQIDYTGGTFVLDGSGPWTDDMSDLTGPVLGYQIVTTITYVGGQVAAQVSNITFSGLFDDCDAGDDICEIEFAIANAALVWRSDSGQPMPMNYPGFLCSADQGEFFTTSDITLSINCPVGVEGTSLSDVKGLYR